MLEKLHKPSFDRRSRVITRQIVAAEFFSQVFKSLKFTLIFGTDARRIPSVFSCLRGFIVDTNLTNVQSKSFRSAFKKPEKQYMKILKRVMSDIQGIRPKSKIQGIYTTETWKQIYCFSDCRRNHAQGFWIFLSRLSAKKAGLLLIENKTECGSKKRKMYKKGTWKRKVTILWREGIVKGGNCKRQILQ